MNESVLSYAVIGHPVSHSQSPLIHQSFAAQRKMVLDYRRLPSPPDRFVATVDHFLAAGGRGLNVTLPFKEDAWRYCTCHGALAAEAAAVNTIVVEKKGVCRGENTDGTGLVRDLVQHLHKPLAGAKILLIGAGGAARGVLGPLLRLQPSWLYIANRNAAKAHHLAQHFSACGVKIAAGGLDFSGQQGFDLVVNATAAGLAGDALSLPRRLLGKGAWAYDMLYGEKASDFMCWALSEGAVGALDGRGMLVEQAAESFFLWHGWRPDTAAARQLLGAPRMP